MTTVSLPLRRIAHFAYGSALADGVREAGSIPVFGSNGTVGWNDRANTRAPVIVIGRKGSFGKLQYSQVPVFAIDTTFFVDASQTAANLRWLYYALQTMGLDSLSEDVGVPGLSRERVYQQRLRLVPLPEQRAIADYLDGETAHIDALIEKKRRMVELLREKRISLIADTIEGKVSTIDMPIARTAHRLRDIAIVTVSNVDKKSQDDDLPVRLCNYVDVYNNERITSDLPFMMSTATPEQVRQFHLHEGDVLVTKDSETADDIAVPAYVAAEMPHVICGYHLAIVRPHAGVCGRYLFWALASHGMRRYFSSMANGVTRFGLRQDVLAHASISLPEPASQQAIAAYLDIQTTHIDALIAKYTRTTDLLAEYRKALITSVITGESAVPLPAEELVAA